MIDKRYIEYLESKGVKPMSDTYTRFLRYFKAQVAVNGWSYETVAEVMNVHPNTIRNWFAGRSMMDGDAVLRCIKLILGGYQC